MSHTSKIHPKEEEEQEQRLYNEQFINLELDKQYQDKEKTQTPNKTNRQHMNDWIENFAKIIENNEQLLGEEIDSTWIYYKLIIILRVILRVTCQITIVLFIIGIFLWGYFGINLNQEWEAHSNISNININVGNCFINTTQTDNNLSFNYFYKGGLLDRQFANENYQISGDILSNGDGNLTFYNNQSKLYTCVVDLFLPKNINNLNIVCKAYSTCIIVFAQELLSINNQFNATSEMNGDLSINIRNIKTNNFIFYSESSGNLFLNHFSFISGSIRLKSGDIVLQSTNSFKLQYNSQSQLICASSYQIQNNISSNCQFDETTNIDAFNYCNGSMELCGQNECSLSQQIQVIGNQSSIYANVIFQIGKPLVQESDSFDILQTILLKKQNINFNSQQIENIKKFVNRTGSADYAVRLDVGGNYLMQSSQSSFWTFFNNPSYAAFSPWWLSTFSATLLSPQFTHLQMNLAPGFCPWNPALNILQLKMIQDLIEETFDTTYGKAIFIEPNEFIQQNNTLNYNLNYTGINYLGKNQREFKETWLEIIAIANNYIYQPLSYDPFFIAAIVLSFLSAIIFGVICLITLVYALRLLENYAIQQITTYYYQNQCKNLNSDFDLQRIVKQMVLYQSKLQTIYQLPLIQATLSYIIYSTVHKMYSAPKAFCEFIFRKSNSTEQKQLYEGLLNEQHLRIDEKQLIELYEQFCFSNSFTITPLNEQEQLFKYYGFIFAQRDDVCYLQKIKFNSKAKPFKELSEIEQNIQNSIQLFIATQCLLTDNINDQIRSDEFEIQYKKFCGNLLTIQQFKIEEIVQKYSLLISDNKIQELKYSSQFKNGYILTNKYSILSLAQNPIQTIQDKLHNCKQFQNKVDLFIDLFLDGLNSLYTYKWWLTDIIIVISNLLVQGITTIPILFFILITNTSYSPYSILDTKALLYFDDILNRPWTIFNYFQVMEIWNLVFLGCLAYYAYESFTLQFHYYKHQVYPEEFNFILEFYYYQGKFASLNNFFYWLLFGITSFCTFLYFGVIIVWLLLGSIINPNFYLVYSSSALSLIAFIAAQIQQLQFIIKQASQEIQRIIQEIYLKQFTQLLKALVQEFENFTDLSLMLIKSINMDQAKEMASVLGINEELNQLCISRNKNQERNTINLKNQEDQFNFQVQRFEEKCCKSFTGAIAEKTKIPIKLAEYFIRVNFNNNEEVLNFLDSEISIPSNTVPMFLLKWNYSTCQQLGRIYQKQSDLQINQELQVVLPQISLDMLQISIKSLIPENNINDNGEHLFIFQNVINTIYNIIKDSSKGNIFKQIIQLFQKIENVTNQNKITFRDLETCIILLNNYFEIKNKQEQLSMIFSYIVQYLKIDPIVISIQNVFYSNSSLLSTSQEQANFFEKLYFKYFLNTELDSITKQQISTFILFAFKYLRNESPPIQNILQLFDIIMNKENKNKSNKFQLSDDIQAILNIIFSALQLSTKNWNIYFQKKLKGDTLDLYNDVVSLCSHFLWTANYISCQNSQQQTFETLSTNNFRNNSRVEYLIHQDLTILISKALNLSEEAVIGLICILRNEINCSYYLQSFYTDILKIVYDKSYNYCLIKYINDIINIMSTTNYEELFFLFLEFQNVQIMESFLNLVFASKTMFALFNGKRILDKQILQQTKIRINLLKKYYAMGKLQLFGTQLQESYPYRINMKINICWESEQEQQSELQVDQTILNYYKSEKYNFFTFLKYSSPNEQSIQKEKEGLLFYFDKQKLIPLEYIYMLLELQQEIMLNSSQKTILLQGLEIQGLQNLLTLLKFKDSESVTNSLQYFINFNPQSYQNIDYVSLQVEIQKLINVEQNIVLWKIPHCIPFNLQKLQPLFVNQLFNCNQLFSTSIYIDVINWWKQQIMKDLSKEKVFQLEKDFALLENFINLLFEKNQSLKNYSLKQIVLSLNPITYNMSRSQRRKYSQMTESISNFMCAIFNDEYHKGLDFLISNPQFIQMENQNFFKLILGFLQGLVAPQQIQWQDNTTPISKIAQKLKYWICLDSSTFFDLINLYIAQMPYEEKPNVKIVQGLFSIITDTPDYLTLKQFFMIDEKTLQFANFLVRAYCSNSKNKLLQDQDIQLIIKKYYNVQSVKPLIDLSSILEMNEVNSEVFCRQWDWTKQQIDLFSQIYYLNIQINKRNSWKEFQIAFKYLYEKRLKIYQDEAPQELNEEELQSLELFHWFAYPRPTDFILMMRHIKMFHSKETACLFTASVASIGKYDRFKCYLDKQSFELATMANNIEKLYSDSIDKVLAYIRKTSNQDLIEAFAILQIATGIDVLFISALFNEDQNNNCQITILENQAITNQKLILEFLKKFDSFEEINAIQRIQIIEFETLKVSQSGFLKDYQQQYFQRILNVNDQEFQIIQEFLVSISKRNLSLQQQFPFSTIILIFALKHLRNIKQSSNLPQEKYIKGEYCINLAFTIFEKHQFFFNNKALVNVNKAALVKLIAEGLFSDQKLKQLQQQVMDDSNIGELMYPGLADPLLQNENFSLINLEEKNQNIKQYFTQNQQQYYNIFFNVDKLELKEEHIYYNQFWTNLMNNGSQITDKIQPIFVQNSNKINFYKDSKYSDTKEYTQQIQQQLLQKYLHIEFQSFRFIQTKNVYKQIKLLKKQRGGYDNKNDEEIKYNKIIAQLFHFYRGEFTRSINNDQNEKSKVNQLTNQLQKNDNLKCDKQNSPIILETLILNILELRINQTKQQNLKPLIDILYNSKIVETEILQQLDSNSTKQIDTIMFMIIRMKLEKAKEKGKFSKLIKSIPINYLYFSLGDQYETFSNEQYNRLKLNSQKFTDGLLSIIKECQDLSYLRNPLSLLLRCHLGDTEAWYALIVSGGNELFEIVENINKYQSIFLSNSLEQKQFQQFITSFLVQLKQLQLRSINIKKYQLSQLSFFEIIKVKKNVNIINLIQISLMEMKNIEENPQTDQLDQLRLHDSQKDTITQKLIKKLSQKLQQPKNEYLFQTIETIQSLLQLIFYNDIEVFNQKSFINIIKDIFKEDKNEILNSFFKLLIFFKNKQTQSPKVMEQIYQQLDEICKMHQNKWLYIIKIFIEYDHMNNLNNLISLINKTMQQSNSTNLFAELNLLSSLVLILQIPFYQQSNDHKKQVTIHALIQIFFWIFSLSNDQNENNQCLEHFVRLSKQFIEKTPEQDYSTFLTNEIKLSGSLIHLSFIKQIFEDFQSICKSYQCSELEEFVNFVMTKVFDISEFENKQFPFSFFNQLLFEQDQDQDLNTFGWLIKQLNQQQSFQNKEINQSLLSTLIVFKKQGLQLDNLKTIIRQFIKNNTEVPQMLEMLLKLIQKNDIESLKQLPQLVSNICFEQELQVKNKQDQQFFDQFFLMAKDINNFILELENSRFKNEFEILNLMNPVLRLILKNQYTDLTQECCKSMIAIKNKEFDQISDSFFKVLKISKCDREILLNTIKQFQSAIEYPQKLIKQKSTAFENHQNIKIAQQINYIMEKLDQNQELQYEDVFCALDKENKQYINVREVLQFIKNYFQILLNKHPQIFSLHFN